MSFLILKHVIITLANHICPIFLTVLESEIMFSALTLASETNCCILTLYFMKLVIVLMTRVVN
jgi:hypothetical protein